MDFLPKVTCRRCHREYSALRSRCPQCGTKKVRAGERTTTSSAASADSAENMKWQFIFGIIVVSAVILAVMVLILISIGGEEPVEPSTPITEPPPTETIPPTVAPTPTPEVTNIDIQYYGQSRNSGITIAVGDKIDLTASIYPLTVDAGLAEWKSEKTEILTVTRKAGSNTYTLEGISAGSANIFITCGAFTRTCYVVVRQSWTS